MNKHLLISVSVLLLSGCQTFQQYQSPENPQGAVTTDLSIENAETFQAIEPVSEWWMELGDPLLADLVEQGLEHNQDVEIALANLSEARAIVRETSYDRYPTVTTSASATRQRISKEGASGASPNRTFYQFEAGFDASWELDLFGRVSQRIAAEEAFQEATIADLNDVYVTVSAEIARVYIELRGAQYRLGIAERNAQNQKETFDLTVKLANGGRATALDTSRAETQLNLTLASIPPLKAQMTASINRLSVLTGHVPDHLREMLNEIKPLPDIPVVVNVGDVSGLIARRPDISRAERVLAASVARYNVSTTDLLPTVNLFGFLGFVATKISSLGTGSALSAFVGPTLSWRAFDLGRVKAQVDQNDARAQLALVTYEKTVLLALEEIQTSLSEFTYEEQRRASLEKASLSSRESATIARERYRLGVDAFLDVLDAERTQLETEDALAVSEIQTATDLVSIYKALAGGWQFASEDLENQE